MYSILPQASPDAPPKTLTSGKSHIIAKPLHVGKALDDLASAVPATQRITPIDDAAQPQPEIGCDRFGSILSHAGFEHLVVRTADLSR
jgi:hypothetical protein